MTAPDLAQRIERLISAAKQAGREIEQGHGLASEIQVTEARHALYDRLREHGLDGTGWIPEPPTREEFAELERERDNALLNNEVLNGIVIDLHERLAHERERADRAEASASVAVSGWL